MHKQSAVWLRSAFKRVAAMETDEMPNSDYLEIKMTLSGSSAVLCFSKDGKLVAMAPVTNADLKRIKADLAFTKRVRAGNAQSIHEQHR